MYIIAGIQTITSLISNKFGIDTTRKCLSKVCDGGLISFGIALDKKKRTLPPYEKYIKSLRSSLDWLEKLHDCLDFKIDSGGYQISTGYIKSEYIPQYIEYYKRFLVEYKDKYESAFSLDIPYCPGILTNMDEMYKLNKASYESLTELDKEIRDKLYFVSHFRTLELLKCWNKLIFEDRLIDHFGRYSVGGLVAGDQKAARRLPYSPLVTGTLQIFTAIDKFSKDTHYHILGMSTETALVLHHFVRRELSKRFGTNVKLSFDSSATFKKVQKAKSVSVFDDEHKICFKISLKSSDLDVERFKGKTNREIALEHFYELKDYVGLDIDPSHDFYDPEKDSFDERTLLYSLLIDSYTYRKLDQFIQERVNSIYDNEIYKDDFRLLNEISQILISVNGGKLTQNIKDFSNVILGSIRAISNYTYDQILEKSKTYTFATDREDLSCAPTF